MRKQWLGICIAAGMLAACTSDDGQQQTVSVPQPAVCNGPIVEISGADPRFEPLNATANQDYQRDGKSYKIVQDPSRFSQAVLRQKSCRLLFTYRSSVTITSRKIFFIPPLQKNRIEPDHSLPRTRKKDGSQHTTPPLPPLYPSHSHRIVCHYFTRI